MSLINQMLRDLEARRGGEERGDKLLHGVKVGAVHGAPRTLVRTLSAVVLLLLLAVGYLGWGRLQTDSAKSAAGSAVTSAAGVSPTAGVTPAQRRPAAPPLSPPKLTAPEGRHAPAVAAVKEPAPKAPVPAPRPPVASATLPAAVAPRHESPMTVPKSAPEVVKTAPSTSAHRDPAIARNSERSEVHVRRHPTTPEQRAASLYQQAYTLLQSGQRGKAETRLREALQVDPSHLQSREVLAGLLLAAGRVVEAGDVLRRGLQLHPHYGKFAMLYARVLVQQQDLPAAVGVLEKGMSGSATPDYFAFLAALYQRQGQYSKSVAAYRRALEAAPDQAVWWMGLGISLENAGDPEQAGKAYQQALQNGISGELRGYVLKRQQALGNAANG